VAGVGATPNPSKETSMSKILPACLAAGLIGFAAMPASAALSSADRDFAMKAASGGMGEVQTAQLAQDRSASPQVKQFAQRMITDHTAANNELMQIAKQANIDLPSQPTGKDASEAQRLRGLQGAQFDQAYSQAELRDHQADVQLFQKEADSGQDAALKSFAQKTLPVLQQHLQLAEALNKR
jgi:putative membrane protein